MGRSSSQPTQTAAGLNPSIISNPGIAVDAMPSPTVVTPLPSPPINFPMPPRRPQPPAMVKPSGPNVFQQAQGYQTQAGSAYGDLANFQMTPMQAAQIGPAQTMQAAQIGPAQTMQGVGAVQAAQAPEQIAVNQLATTNLDPYMSPYQQQVIEAGQADIERQRQLASENLAAQAQRAGAFGGSRQAVQEGVLAGEALRQAGALSAQQRQRAFETALQSGQFDIGQMQQARTMASQQQFQANQLGQQAREAAAAREQAARAGNMQAANQFAAQQAQLEQQSRQLNQSAQNQFAMQQAQLEQQARQATFGGQFQAAGVRQAGAAGLGGLGQQLFGQGQQVQQQIARQAAQQRALQQQMIDAQRQQFAGATGAPLAGLGALSQVMGTTPYPTSTTTSQPFNPASLLMLL